MDKKYEPTNGKKNEELRDERFKQILGSGVHWLSREKKAVFGSGELPQEMNKFMT